jgi:alpha-1,3-mannosyltransferase
MKAAECGLAEGYISIESNVDDAAMPERLSRCSYFVSASQYEGFGLTAVEALGAGLIPVLNAIPSFTKIVGEAGVGTLARFDDADRAARAMLDTVAATAPGYAAQREAAMRAVRRYEWPTVERQFRREYEQIVGVGRRTLLGVQFQVLTQAEAVAALDSALECERPTRVTFANAHTLRLASRTRALRDVLNTSLVLNDGVGVDIASRMKFGKRFPDNLNGTDFVPHFLDATRHRLRIYLLGARSDVVKKAADVFSARWPHHAIVGTRDGFFQSGEADAICAAINQARPDVLLVAFGNTKQEEWLARHGPALSSRLQLGVGACSTSAPVMCRAHRRGCGARGWNGCIASRSNRGACSRGTLWATPCSCGSRFSTGDAAFRPDARRRVQHPLRPSAHCVHARWRE